MNKRTVWAVWTNSDLTEGRGTQYVKHYCSLEATARRLAKGGYVMGTDCPLSQTQLFYIEGNWYAPGPLVNTGSIEDLHEEEKIKAKREAENRKKQALDRARELGMTEEEIAALSE
jgi:hypothetical protein